MLIDRISERYAAKFGDKKSIALSQHEVTNLMYETTLPELRKEIEAYALNKEGVHVLFDNVDKGWNADGLEEADVIMIRTLLDASRKLQNDFRRNGTDFHCVVFLRNDIYDILISSTSDRGKDSKILVDWSSPELLKQMIRRRLLFNSNDKTLSVDALWHELCIPIVDGEASLDYLLKRSLMRPRYFLRLINHCIGNAINFERERVDDGDIELGLSSYSTDIITEIDLEIRDVLSENDDILYILLGEKSEMKRDEMMELLKRRIPDDKRVTAIFTLLLWHGVIGFKRDAHDATYIFDVNYDLKRLLGLLEKAPTGNPVMQINPAFWPGLELV